VFICLRVEGSFFAELISKLLCGLKEKGKLALRRRKGNMTWMEKVGAGYYSTPTVTYQI